MPTPKHLTDDVQGAYELGPRSLALLRRILVGIETLAGGKIADPGKEYEDETITWPTDDDD